VKKILIAIALLGLVTSNAEARGWHGHGHHHGGGSSFFFGAALGAALTLPFYYSRAWDPGPYYYYNRGPVVYVNPPVYVQSQPNHVVTAAQPGNVVTPAPSNGVIELGPVNSLPPANSNPVPGSNSSRAPDANADPLPADQWFVYPGRGQSPQQQANDRYECNRWATSESGYDPELRKHRNPETGPVAYGRALSACLEGRGYAVK
jgi:hypothetical protein